jgi:hypothetical protein
MIALCGLKFDSNGLSCHLEAPIATIFPPLEDE